MRRDGLDATESEDREFGTGNLWSSCSSRRNKHLPHQLPAQVTRYRQQKISTPRPGGDPLPAAEDFNSPPR